MNAVERVIKAFDETSQNEEIMQKDKELNELRNKWEAVELIFGGK